MGDSADESDLHTLAGAYAMDAVGEADRVSFEQHLAACAECRSEISGLHEATARLALAAAIRPRGELRAATLRAAARVRQLPPGLADTGRWRARRGLAGRPLRLALAMTGMLAVAVAVLALLMSGTQHRLDQEQRGSQAIAVVLTAPDATMLTADVRSGGTATVVMSHQQHALVFTARDLRPLPSAERYELWLMRPGGMRPAGMLSAASAGMISPMVVSGLTAADRIVMTVEPASGSVRPTSSPVLLLALGPR